MAEGGGMTGVTIGVTVTWPLMVTGLRMVVNVGGNVVVGVVPLLMGLVTFPLMGSRIGVVSLVVPLVWGTSVMLVVGTVGISVTFVCVLFGTKLEIGTRVGVGSNSVGAVLVPLVSVVTLASTYGVGVGIKDSDMGIELAGLSVETGDSDNKAVCETTVTSLEIGVCEATGTSLDIGVSETTVTSLEIGVCEGTGSSLATGVWLTGTSATF